MRTTSSVESLNSVLGRSCPRHPHLYRFIDYLMLHEFNKSVEKWEIIKGNINLQRKRKVDQNREQKIQYWTGELKKGAVSVQQFLIGVAYLEILSKNGS